MERSRKPISIALLEKLRIAELEIMGNKPKRRSSKQVIFDKRWRPRSELPQYLALFFLVFQNDIILAGHKWKDLILDVILKREAGERVYDSLYIPDNNI